MSKATSSDPLMAEYRKLAKRADQRMVRLEQAAGQNEGFKNILKYAYANAQKDLRKWTRQERRESGRPLRFNTAPPRTKTGQIDRRSLQEKIRVIRRFLDAQTSSVKKAKETLERPVKTINETYGTNFTWETLAKYFEDGTADKLNKEYGSKTALRIIGQIQKKPDEVLKQLELVGPKRIKSDNPFLNRKVNHVLNMAGIKLKELIPYEG